MIIYNNNNSNNNNYHHHNNNNNNNNNDDDNKYKKNYSFYGNLRHPVTLRPQIAGFRHDQAITKGRGQLFSAPLFLVKWVKIPKTSGKSMMFHDFGWKTMENP